MRGDRNRHVIELCEFQEAVGLSLSHDLNEEVSRSELSDTLDSAHATLERLLNEKGCEHCNGL